MGKGKRPRKPKPSPLDQIPPSDEEPERQTQAKGELGPPARRPPTAVGTDSPPPGPEPVQLPQRRSPLPERSSPAPSRPVLYDVLQTLRTAVGAMLDIADAAAEAITRRLEGRGRA